MTTLERYLNKLGPDAKSAVKEGGREIYEKALHLQELRERLGMSQGDVAKKVGVGQPRISKLEASSSPTIGAVREYVEALGAKLEIAAVLPSGRRVRIDNPSDVDAVENLALGVGWMEREPAQSASVDIDVSALSRVFEEYIRNAQRSILSGSFEAASSVGKVLVEQDLKMSVKVSEVEAGERKESGAAEAESRKIKHLTVYEFNRPFAA